MERYNYIPASLDFKEIFEQYPIGNLKIDKLLHIINLIYCMPINNYLKY